METTGRETEWATADERSDAADGRPVRVSYVAQGFGVALIVDAEPTTDDDSTDSATTDAVGSGVLRVSDAVVTLEIPLPDGGRSVLSWDPAEVGFDPLVA